MITGNCVSRGLIRGTEASRRFKERYMIEILFGLYLGFVLWWNDPIGVEGEQYEPD